MAEGKPSDAIPAEIQKQAVSRIAQARMERNWFATDFNEAFKFCLRYRTPVGMTSNTTPTMPSKDNFDDLGPMMTTDFASMIADTFFPEHARWANTKVSAAFKDAPNFKDIQEQVAAENDAVFEAIGLSNFYEAGKQTAKDLSISTGAITIEDPGAGQPIRCQPIPINELLIRRAPSGGLGERFWERYYTVDDIRAIFPDVPLPAKVAAKHKPGSRVKVAFTQGCWRDYTKPGEIAWHVVTLVDSEVVQYSRNIGAGSAPIYVLRWDPDPQWAWGIGPAINALPSFRECDELNYLHLKGLARRVDPPVAYDDDGVVNLDDGLSNGQMVPRLKGSSIDVIESDSDLGDSDRRLQVIEQRIRRHYYLDEPQQQGLTPPTLGQWLDQSMRVQRRLGTPAAPIWSEFLSEVYLRFRYLLMQRGTLKKELKVGNQVIQLTPINPLLRAAEQDEAAASEKLLAGILQLFGEEVLQATVKIPETIANLQQALDAKAVELQDPDVATGNIKQIAQNAQLQAAAKGIGAAGGIGALASATTGGQQQ